MIYFLILLLLILGVLLYDFGNSKRQNAYYKIILIIFILLSGIAYKVGADIPNYMKEFDTSKWSDLRNISILGNRQFLWIFLQNICKSIIDSFSFFKIIISVIFYSILFKFFKNYSEHFFTVILIFFVVMSFDINFNILRQSLAIAFFIYSVKFIEKNHYLKSYILIFVAILFHNTAVVLILLPILNAFDLRRHSTIIPFLSAAIILLCLIFVPEIVQLISQSNNDVAKMALYYTMSDAYSDSMSLSPIIAFQILFKIIIFLYSLKYSNLKNIVLLSCLLYIVIFVLSIKITIMGRLLLYFTPAYLICLTEAIYIAADKFIVRSQRKIVVLLLVWLSLVIPLHNLYEINPRYRQRQYIQYFPYYSIITQRTDPIREQLFN